MEIIKFIIANWELIITAIIAFLSGAVSILNIIPGEQGESKIQWVIDGLKKIIGFKQPPAA